MHTETVYGSGEIRGGRLKLTRIPALDTLRDGPVEIVVSRRRATRSQQANNYYWGVVLAYLSDYTGYSRDDLHDICKAKFLPRQLAVCDGNGELVDSLVIGGSTTKLTTAEFGDYTERIRVWAGELGCLIPEPGEG